MVDDVGDVIGFGYYVMYWVVKMFGVFVDRWVGCDVIVVGGLYVDWCFDCIEFEWDFIKVEFFFGQVVFVVYVVQILEVQCFGYVGLVGILVQQVEGLWLVIQQVVVDGEGLDQVI